MDEIPNKSDTNRRADGTFMPGTVHNAKGRPKKGNAWADIREELLSASKIRIALTTPDKFGNERTRLFSMKTDEEKSFRYAILVRQIQNALSGDNDSIRDLMDRQEGKPRQTLDHSVTSIFDDEQGDPDVAIIAMIKKVIDQ
jgi:hypothetical protein